MSQSSQLIKKKKSLLLNVLKLYKNYGYNVESAIQSFQEADDLFKDMAKIDTQLSDSEKETFRKTYKDTWEAVIQKHKEMMSMIKVENTLLKNQMTQVNKKNQVIHNYMDKNESMFLDRQA